MEFIDYCLKLSPSDWLCPVNEKWLVKDVVIHMLNWEREVTLELRKARKTMQKPWFVDAKPTDYDEFNARIGDAYQDLSPLELLAEWKKWQGKLDSELKIVEENNQKAQLEKLGWVFEKRPDSHYSHHLNQIKKAVTPELSPISSSSVLVEN